MYDKTPRIRGRALQRIRREHFARNPLCVRCQAKGRVELATELDHIEPLFKGGRDDSTNRQGLCEACHAAKTAEDMGHANRQAIGPDGWPAAE